MNSHKPTLGLTRISRGHRPPLNPPVPVEEGAESYHIHRRNVKRRELFDAQDAIDDQWAGLIGKIEKHLKHNTSTVHTLFMIGWGMV